MCRESATVPATSHSVAVRLPGLHCRILAQMNSFHSVGRLGAIVVLLAAVYQTPVAAEPSTTGQTGLINMPDARIEKDGTLRFGTSYFRPYLPIWSSITLLPRLELSGRYTIIRGLSGGLGQGFGDPDRFSRLGAIVVLVSALLLSRNCYVKQG